MLARMKQLWADDRGALISTEWVLVAAVILFGIIPGLVATRNGVNASQGTIANQIVLVAPNFSYAGYSIDNSLDNTISIGAVSGAQLPDDVEAQLLFLQSPFFSTGETVQPINGATVNTAP